MNAAGFKHKLRRIAGRLRDRMGPRAAILLYHRVADTPTDPYLLRVRTKNFAEQMDVLKRRGGVLPLRDLAARHREGRLPHGAVAITFDDGYVDNLRTAKPMLAKRGLPATVFMTAGSVGREREFWWDELERLLLLPGTGDVQGFPADDAGLSQAVMREILSVPVSPAGGVWDLTQPHDPTPRHALLRRVHAAVRVMPHESRQAVLDRLRAWAGAADEVRPEFRAMNPDEMRELADGGLIEVGAHTITHPSLPPLTPEALQHETNHCRERLEEILGRAVTSFAYPYGDHDDAVVRAVAGAGYETACVCEGRVAVPRSHPLRLPRVDVLDWDGETFERQLDRWLRG